MRRGRGTEGQKGGKRSGWVMTERKTRIVRDTKRVRLDVEREMRGKSVVKEAGGVGGMDG